MDKKALFCKCMLLSECYRSFEFVNGHGITRNEVLSLN